MTDNSLMRSNSFPFSKYLQLNVFFLSATSLKPLQVSLNVEKFSDVCKMSSCEWYKYLATKFDFSQIWTKIQTPE